MQRTVTYLKCLFKDLIPLFIFIFVLMFLVGYQVGKTEISKTNYVNENIFKDLYPVVTEKKVYLLRERNQHDFIYDVDKNKLITSPLYVENTTIENIDIIKNIVAIDGGLITSTLGGAALGYSLKDLIKERNSALKVQKYSNIRIIVIDIVASFSGYSLGYWLAIRNEVPEEGSNELLSILTDEKNWEKYEIYLFNNLAKSLKNDLDDIQSNEYRKYGYYLEFSEISCAITDLCGQYGNTKLQTEDNRSDFRAELSKCNSYLKKIVGAARDNKKTLSSTDYINDLRTRVNTELPM